MIPGSLALVLLYPTHSLLVLFEKVWSQLESTYIDRFSGNIIGSSFFSNAIPIWRVYRWNPLFKFLCIFFEMTQKYLIYTAILCRYISRYIKQKDVICMCVISRSYVKYSGNELFPFGDSDFLLLLLKDIERSRISSVEGQLQNVTQIDGGTQDRYRVPLIDCISSA